MPLVWEPPELTPLGRIRLRGCWGYRLLIAVLLAHAAIAIGGAIAIGQSQDAINERQRALTEGLAARVDWMERQNIGGRVQVLESDMYEVKWLARGVALSVLGQLVMAARGRRKEE